MNRDTAELWPICASTFFASFFTYVIDDVWDGATGPSDVITLLKAGFLSELFMRC